jgi:prevent-host-death family protein
MREIEILDAKASLSAVVDEAVRGKPSIITRHGKREAVIMSLGVGAVVAGAILRPATHVGAGRSR